MQYTLTKSSDEYEKNEKTMKISDLLPEIQFDKFAKKHICHKNSNEIVVHLYTLNLLVQGIVAHIR